MNQIIPLRARQGMIPWADLSLCCIDNADQLKQKCCKCFTTVLPINACRKMDFQARHLYKGRRRHCGFIGEERHDLPTSYLMKNHSACWCEFSVAASLGYTCVRPQCIKRPSFLDSVESPNQSSAFFSKPALLACSIFYSTIQKKPSF